jgi:hypothetical protein
VKGAGGFLSSSGLHAFPYSSCESAGAVILRGHSFTIFDISWRNLVDKSFPIRVWIPASLPSRLAEWTYYDDNEAVEFRIQFSSP